MEPTREVGPASFWDFGGDIPDRVGRHPISREESLDVANGRDYDFITQILIILTMTLHYSGSVGTHHPPRERYGSGALIADLDSASAVVSCVTSNVNVCR
uniref:Uncharacterized protein n=1 Tax=Nelumbo nucifera TaxID=4432 RepID=A0A822YKS2_NELNU|nr:TPA_asm: hypothetical protein HUJ06_011948 [Nelumbo nucifera]